LLRRAQQEEQAEKQEPLFREPKSSRLNGQIQIGLTVPSGHPVHLPIEAFGATAHVGVYGTTGRGKSVWLDWVTVQLIQQGCIVIVFDTLNQCAQRLVSIVPSDKLNVINYQNYRCAFLRSWRKAANDHLESTLGVSNIAINQLIIACKEIVEGGHKSTVLRLVNALEGMKGQEVKALLNRLYPMIYSDLGIFTCERGFDMKKLLGKSLILEIKGIPDKDLNLIFNDLYYYLISHWKSLDKWKLRFVFVFHEARPLVQNPNEFFKRLVSECRNFGIALVMANQAPQVEDTVVTSNIGAKIFFGLENPAALNNFQQVLDLTKDQRREMLTLPPQEMVIYHPRVLEPFRARVPRLI
jgi:hypothetical protein